MNTEAGSRPVVYGAVEHLQREQHAILSAACQEAGAELSPWHPRQASPEACGWPSLLVAGLPDGVRRVSNELCEALNGSFPRVPLLLLCQEALPRPTMLSHGGRVMLLDVACSKTLLASRIRMLTGPDRTLNRRYWLGSARSGPEAMEPFAHQARSGAMTALLPLLREAPSEAMVLRAHAIFTDSDGSNAKHARLSELLGEMYAALHLVASAEKWIAYAPRASHALSLCSAQRLPRIYNLCSDLETSSFRELPAASGDLLVLSSAPLIALLGDETSELADGGPALLASLSGAKFDAFWPFCSLVVELL